MLCKAKDDKLGDDSILRHIGTPNVARDMISIIDAWDAWQDDMKSKKGCNHKATPVQDSGDDGRIKNATENPSESENHLDTKGKLVYWGFSYGTLLGATFSAMFPDRVGRVILDGVVDADHYVGQTWKGALQHSDLVLKTFFRYCHEAGERCAFSRSGETDSDIEKRYLKVMDDFRKNPIIGLEPASQIPMTASVSFLRQVIFSTLYAPIGGFPIVAEILDALEKGKDDIVLGWLRPFSVFFDYQPYCSKAAGPFSGLGGFEAQKAIVCADKRYKVPIHSLSKYL